MRPGHAADLATLPTAIKVDPLPFTEHDVMREVYKASPYFLGREVLGYTKFCETQLEWSQYFTTIYNPKAPARTWSLFLAPRETLKSTFFTVAGIIQILLNNPNLTILIASETVTNAESFLKEIRKKLESEVFRKVFGDIIDPNWNRADSLNLLTRKDYSKEANIETAGLGKAVTGRHYDIIFCDDIAGVADRDSEAKRTITFNFVNDLVDVLKKETGFLNIIGTPWHQADIYAHIEKHLAPDMIRKKVGKFHIWKKPAHVWENGRQTDKLNYPRLLPQSRLDELKTVKQGKDGIDISTFMAQYELNPLSPNEQIFKSFTYATLSTLSFDMMIQWTDPALSDKGTACYAPTVVIGRIAQGIHKSKWMVIYASIQKKDPTRIIKDHNRIYLMVKGLYKCPIDAYMETNGFQMLLRNETVNKALQEGAEVPTIGRANTENKPARIRSMEPYISQGFLLFRDDWETAPEGYALLLEQLTSFPQGYLDGPDALQSAYKQSQSRYL